MTSKRRTLACAVMLLACWLLPAAARAQGVPPKVVCRNGLAVGCAPRRITYGYYPTHWRRWPTDWPIAQPTPAAEQVPTPQPEESKPKVEPEQPSLEPDDEVLFPTDPGTTLPGPTTPSAPTMPSSPTTPGPATTPESGLPFEDRPPVPPGDNDMPTLPETSPGIVPPSSRPATQPQVQPPPSDDAPPTMPDDDPFKDEPAGLGSEFLPPGPEPEGPAAGASDVPSPETPAPGSGPASGSKQPVPENASRQMAMRWRAAGDRGFDWSDLPQSQPEPAASSPDSEAAPEVLPQVKAQAGDGPRLLPVDAPARGNPLRAAATERRDTRVVPAAAWASDAATSTSATTTWRPNPLRNN